MFKIYALTYNNVICYIGQTKLSLSRRFAGKHYGIPYNKKDMNIFLIEETDDVTRERYWIDLFTKHDIQLLNKRGGNLGIANKEERLEYDRIRKKKYYHNQKLF